MKNDGLDCENPVKHEDIAVGNFACGVHMGQFMEDARREEISRKRELQRKEEDEILAWELTIYQEAYDRLTALDPEMFPGDQRPEKRNYGRRFDKSLDLDIIELERWARSYAEDSTAVTG
jgi:hypothetical protein